MIHLQGFTSSTIKTQVHSHSTYREQVKVFPGWIRPFPYAVLMHSLVHNKFMSNRASHSSTRHNAVALHLLSLFLQTMACFVDKYEFRSCCLVSNGSFRSNLVEPLTLCRFPFRFLPCSEESHYTSDHVPQIPKRCQSNRPVHRVGMNIVLGSNSQERDEKARDYHSIHKTEVDVVTSS